MIYIILKNQIKIKLRIKTNLLFIFTYPSIDYENIMQYLNKIDIHENFIDPDEIIDDGTTSSIIEDLEICDVFTDKKGKMHFNFSGLKTLFENISKLFIYIRTRKLKTFAISSIFLTSISFIDNFNFLNLSKGSYIYDITNKIEHIIYKRSHGDLLYDQAAKNSSEKIPLSNIKQVIDESLNYKNYKIILSIIYVESKFDSLLVNDNRQGLGQINIDKYKDILKTTDKRQVLEIKNNIKYINDILTVFNNDNIKDTLTDMVGDEDCSQIIDTYVSIDYILNK